MDNNLKRTRIVVNKYTEKPSEIIPDVFSSGYGEIALSIDKCDEGIFLKNNENEVVRLTNMHQDLTKSQYAQLLKEGKLLMLDSEGNEKTIIYKDSVYYMVYEDEITPDFSSSAITLTENYTPFETVVIDGGSKILNLNNKKMVAPIFFDESGNSNSYGLWVKQGLIKIVGDGIIKSQDAKYSIAIWANGGKVIISGGTFYNGGDGCDLIYASAGGQVEIHDGEFIATEYKGTESGTTNPHSALNVENNDREYLDIKVYGGSFYKFNPARPNPSEEWLEKHPNGFVADGYESVEEGDWWIVRAKEINKEEDI